MTRWERIQRSAPAPTRSGLAVYVLNDPQYWRKQAEEMAAQASAIKDHVTRQAMRRIASDYKILAKRAEDRLASVTYDEHD